jgi:hypothetical protein
MPRKLLENKAPGVESKVLILFVKTDKTVHEV